MTFDKKDHVSIEINKDANRRFRRSPNWSTLLALTLSMIVSVVSFNNCSNEFVAGSANDLASFYQLSSCDVDLMRSFQSTIHPFASSQCVSCHTSAGPSNDPFADAGLLAAFNAFKNVGMTKFKSFALNPGHAFGFTGTQHESAISSIASAWNVAKNSPTCSAISGPDGEVDRTISKVMSAPVINPTQANPTMKTIVWNLDEELEGGPIDLGGAKLEIQVGQYTPPGGNPMYYYRRPIIKTAMSAIAVKSLFIYVNDKKIELGTTFSEVDTVVPAGTTNVTLSNATLVWEFPNGIADDDSIAVSFGLLEKSQ